MKNTGEPRDLEADLTEMGSGMTYPTIPNPAPAVVARVETAQGSRLPLLPSLAPSRRWLVGVPAASILVAVLIVAYLTYGGAEAPGEVAREAEVGAAEVRLLKLSIGPRWEPRASWPVNLANTTKARLSTWSKEEGMSVTIIGLTLTAIGSVGALAGLVWLRAIRSGFEFPRRYGTLNSRRAVIVTAAAVALAVLGFVISDTRRIPDLFPAFLAAGSLATFGAIWGLSSIARVRSGDSAVRAVIPGAVAALVVAGFISLGIPLGEGEPGAEGDYLSSLIFFGFAVPFVATVGGLLWLPVALIRRRGRSATAAFVWWAASLAVVGLVGIGIWMRLGEEATIEGLELLSVALDERPDAPMSGVNVHGSYAFVGGQSTSYRGRHKQGVRILDISDPASPTLVGRIPLRSFEKFSKGEHAHSHGDAVATRIESDAFQGDIAVVLNGVPDTFNVDDYPLPYGIWDVSDPAEPRFLSVLNLGSYYYFDDQGDKPNDDKAINGHYFYAVYNRGHDPGNDKEIHLAVVDLSDPRNPVVVGDWHDGGLRGGLTRLSLNKAGTRAYVVGKEVKPVDGGHRHTANVLYVLDLLNPTAPVEIGRYAYPHQKYAAYAVPNEDDSLVIFADGSSACGQKASLRFLDTSDPGSIHEVSVFELAGSERCYLWEMSDVGEAGDMVVKGNLVYSTWMAGGLRAIDFSDPANPVEVGKLILSPGSPWLSDVALYGDVVLATEIWNAGLYLLR